jgi:hypothetical protein
MRVSGWNGSADREAAIVCEARVQPTIHYFTFMDTFACNGGGLPIQAYLGTSVPGWSSCCVPQPWSACTLAPTSSAERGAYVTKKAKLAESLGLGVPSPNDGSILYTHDRYPGCDAFIM